MVQRKEPGILTLILLWVISGNLNELPNVLLLSPLKSGKNSILKIMPSFLKKGLILQVGQEIR